MTETETDVCRGCRKVLDGKPYFMGGRAYDPIMREQAKVNHYGGFVCSRECDVRASLALERSMPGHGYDQKYLGCYAAASVKANWGDAP